MKTNRYTQPAAFAQTLGTQSLRFLFLLCWFAWTPKDVTGQCSNSGAGNTNGNVPFGSSINWANPNRASGSDNLYARTTMTAGEVSKYLLSRDYGFSIPLTATILGVVAEVEKSADVAGTITDASVRLWDGTVPMGNDHAILSGWITVDEVTTYGGPTDLWGLTLTPADVNSADFGFLISATCVATPATAFIDNIFITIYYSDPVGCILSQTAFVAYGQQRNGNVSLYWNLVLPDTRELFVERSIDGITYTGIGKLSPPNAGTFTDNAVPFGNMKYRVGAVLGTGETVYSNTVMVLVNTKEELTLWPNPSSGTTRLHTPDMISGNVQVFNLQGALIFETADYLSYTDVEFDASPWPKGTYIVKVPTESDVYMKKLVVQ